MDCTSGHVNAPELKFCGECGERLDGTAADAGPTPPPPPPPLSEAPAPTDDVPSTSHDAAGADDVLSRVPGPETVSSTPVDDVADGAAEPAEPGSVAPAKTSRRWLIGAGVLAALLVAGVVAAVARGGSDDSELLSGTFTLFDDADSVSGQWDRCSGTGGYDDIGPGMNVTVRDGSGEIIAATSTESMSRKRVEATVMDENGEVNPWDVDEVVETMETMVELGMCVVYFEVDVPVTEFYEVSVGRRGGLSYTLEDLEEADFTVSLSIG